MQRRKRISSQDLQYLIVFATVATLVTSSVAYSILNPPPSERFFAMWILGSTGLAEQYYPGGNPNLEVGEEVNWTLGVYNHMGSIQYVVVRVKLLNSTLPSPDDLTGRPSSIPPTLEFTKILLDNETWSIPFVWKIEEVIQREQNLLLTGMLINQFRLGGELATAHSGINYRFVFELWFYDQELNDLAFSWETNKVQHSVWIQMWFNVTSPAT